MKRFKFKLEAVLSERKRIEDLKLREWTIAKRLVAAMLDELRAMKTRLSEVIGEASGVASVGVLSSTEMFIKGSKLRIEWKGREIDRAEKLTEKKRLEYVQASQKCKALEKLKERQLAEHKAEARKRELKALDDIYIMRAPLRQDQDEEEIGV